MLFLLLLGISLILTIKSHSYHRSEYINSANAITGGVYENINSMNEYLSLKQKNNSLAEENARLKELASIFAEIVNCKSRFTHQHSLGWLGLADTWQHFLVWKMRSEIRLKLLVFCTTWESSRNNFV